MPKIVEASRNEIRYMVHGNPGSGAFEYMREERDRLRDRIDRGSLVLDAVGTRFFEESERVIDRYEENVHRARNSNVVRKFNAMSEADVFKRLEGIGEWQTAKSTMRRAIMAIPEVMELKRKGRIEGYADLFEDLEPNTAPEERMDYRLLNDGMFNFTEDGWEAECVMGVDDSERYSYLEKLDWRDMRREIVASLINPEEDQDPTSPWCADKL